MTKKSLTMSKRLTSAYCSDKSRMVPIESLYDFSAGTFYPRAAPGDFSHSKGLYDTSWCHRLFRLSRKATLIDIINLVPFSVLYSRMILQPERRSMEQSSRSHQNIEPVCPNAYNSSISDHVSMAIVTIKQKTSLMRNFRRSHSPNWLHSFRGRY